MLTCASCGHENPDASRFCGGCGAALAPARAREVRKTVTVVFADVTGSTALGERLDPESFRRVMARYFDTARACLERHGGTVEKFIGDAVVAVFGVPTMHEDDALRALRAAAELRDALVVLNGELERDYGVSLLVRTGVNSGEVVAGTQERLATGDAVNVAARLEQAARPGEILIGEPTCALARGAIDAEPVAPLTLKGKAQPVGAFRLLAVHGGAPAIERHLDTPLVGRRRELELLRAAFEAAIGERRCRLVTVIGPPGIGKSRLAHELGAALAGDATVLVGRCLPYGEGITYWPLVEIFRAAGADAELGAALAAAAPEEIFWSVRKELEQRARDRPLALVVDDIHWAEPTLLDLFEHLVDWTRDAPILLVCLARPELLDARPGWGAREPNGTITLQPLSDAESDELIGGLAAGGEVREETRAQVRRTAEGNPLFVEQLLAALADHGEPAELPPTIHALLAARLDELPGDEREVLERASLIGLEFEWDALAAVAPDGQRPPGARLATLVRKELIRPHETLEDAFRFRHILIRDAAYGRIPKDLRAELHERFADWLEGRGEEFEEIVGYHLEQAYRSLDALGPVGERARALATRAALCLADSGRRADARGDTYAALKLLERAAALLPAGDPRRLALLPPLGRALRTAGRRERAEAVLAEAVQEGRAAGERAVAADAAVALANLRFHRPADTGVGQAEVLREIEAATPIFEEAGDHVSLARALGLAGRLRFWEGEAAAALEDLERAALLARDAGDRGQEAECLRYTAVAMRLGPMPVGEALERCEEIRRSATANGGLEVALLVTRAHLEAMRGRFEPARELIREATALAQRLGRQFMLDAEVAPAAAYVARLSGDTAEAERVLRPACERLERIGELSFLSSVAPMLADAVLAQGRDVEALEMTERWRPERLTVPEDADAQSEWRRVRAMVAARRGDLAEAERLCREAVAIGAGTDFLDLRARTLADLGDILRLAGRPDESAAAVHEAIRWYEQKGNVVAAAALAADDPAAATPP